MLVDWLATWLARPGDLPWLTRVAGWLARWLARVAGAVLAGSSQSASVASQAQPAKRGRWMGSQSALHPAIDPCVDYMDPLIDYIDPLIDFPYRSQGSPSRFVPNYMDPLIDYMDPL